MAFCVDPGKCIFDEMHPETCFQKVFAGVSYAILSGNAADIDIPSIQKLKNLSQRLSGIVDALETGILFACLVASLVESELFDHIGLKVLVDITSMSSGNAVGRPDASLALERAVVGRMMVPDETDGEGVKYLIFSPFIAFSP